MAVSAAAAYYQPCQLHALARAASGSVSHAAARFESNNDNVCFASNNELTGRFSRELSDLQHCINKLSALLLQMSLAIQICAIYAYTEGP